MKEVFEVGLDIIKKIQETQFEKGYVTTIS